MKLLFPIFLFLFGISFLLSAILLFITLASGISLLCAKKGTAAYEARKDNFQKAWKGLAVFLIVAGCAYALMVVFGSQITFSM